MTSTAHANPAVPSLDAPESGASFGTLSARMDDGIDYDLHGIVGVRVVGAKPGDAAVVDRQLGGLKGPLNREPDIVVAFVEPEAAASHLRYLDLNDGAFDDEAFFVLQTRAGVRLKSRIDFHDIGNGCRIVCESGAGSVPLLIAIVNLVAVSKGVLPVHASAFTHHGCGVLVCGWSKGGKTETLLAFMAEGATYVGDEWIYVAQDGRRMYGLPQPITLWDWHLPELPEYQAALARRQSMRLRAFTATQRTADALGRLGTPGSALLERVGMKLERQRYVHMAPQNLFGTEACALDGRLDKLVFVMSRESEAVAVKPTDPRDVARRMEFSLQYERQRLLGSYLQYRFVFPDRSSALLEGVAEREREMLLERFSGTDAYVLEHPFPPSIPSLYRAMQPIVG
jgi:hypothetical protein